MKKLVFLLFLFANISFLYSQTVQICGDFKLTGYYNSGEKFESTLTLTKTDNGVVAKGAINAFLKEQSIDRTLNPDIAVKYTAFIKSTGSWVDISFDKKGNLFVSISGVNDISCKRIK